MTSSRTTPERRLPSKNKTPGRRCGTWSPAAAMCRRRRRRTNGGEPDKASAKRPAAKRKKKSEKEAGAPARRPEQVFAVSSVRGRGPSSPETTTRASEGVATPESIDDIELAPVTENAETRRKNRATATTTLLARPRRRRRLATRLAQTLSCFSAATRTTRRRLSQRPDVLRARCEPPRRFRSACFSATSSGGGGSGSGRREPRRPTRRAKKPRAKPLAPPACGAAPPEVVLGAAVRRVPSAVGVLPLGADVPDAGDGVGGVLFAFPVVSRKSSGSREVPGDEPHPHRGDPRAYAAPLKKYSLRPEHAAARAPRCAPESFRRWRFTRRPCSRRSARSAFAASRSSRV